MADKSDIKDRLILLLTIALTMAAGMNVQAASKHPQRADYFCVGLSGGYTMLLGHASNMQVNGSGGAGIHAGYEFRETNLVIRMTGEFAMLNSSCKSGIKVDDLKFLDTRLNEGTMHYEMLSPLTERQMFGLGGIGVLVGYTSSDLRKSNNSNGGFYAFGGIKLGAKFDLHNTAKLDYVTTATYNRYIEDYEDAPNHYYTTYSESDTVNLKTKFNFMFAVEMGWEISLPHCDVLRIGAFADIGVINQVAGLDQAECQPNPENVSELVLSSHYQSAAMKDKYVVPFMAGLRVTFSLNFTKKKGCSSCKCYK